MSDPVVAVRILEPTAIGGKGFVSPGERHLVTHAQAQDLIQYGKARLSQSSPSATPGQAQTQTQQPDQ
jgi:hypothetical protein